MTLAAQMRGLCSVFVLFGSIWGVSAAESAKQEVDMVLVLAIDASGSIDEREWALEKTGYADALVHPEVLRAIRGGAIGAIAVTVVTWGHPDFQRVVLPWTVIHDASSAEIASSILADLPRQALGNTSISSGIAYSAALIEQAPFVAERKVIDVSGDGFDNTNRRSAPSNTIYNSYYFRETPRSAVNVVDTELLLQVRDATIKKGITINGLPIVTSEVPWLDDYYRDTVIGGPGAFMIAAKDFRSFAEAIRRKLVLEIAGTDPAQSEVQFASK